MVEWEIDLFLTWQNRKHCNYMSTHLYSYSLGVCLTCHALKFAKRYIHVYFYVHMYLIIDYIFVTLEEKGMQF